MSESFLIVDDHPLFLDAIKLAIHSAFPDANMKEAISIDGALEAISKKDDFDLVLLDLTMPGTKGFDGLLELRTKYPKLPIVIVSAMEDPQIIHQSMLCGAAGFISKSIRKSELVVAIRNVLNGSVCLPSDYVPPEKGCEDSTHASLMQRLGTLTPQQLRVLKMLRQGLLNKQIAYDLGVGETTIKAHVSEILRKLQVSSRTQAVIEVTKIDFESYVRESPDAVDKRQS